MRLIAGAIPCPDKMTTPQRTKVGWQTRPSEIQHLVFGGCNRSGVGHNRDSLSVSQVRLSRINLLSATHIRTAGRTWPSARRGRTWSATADGALSLLQTEARREICRRGRTLCGAHVHKSRAVVKRGVPLLTVRGLAEPDARRPCLT